MSRESNKQDNINPAILESNNETKPTESIKLDSIQQTSISTESNKLESKKPNDTKNKDNIKLIISLYFFVCKYIFLVYVLVNDSKSSIFYWYCIA